MKFRRGFGQFWLITSICLVATEGRPSVASAHDSSASHEALLLPAECKEMRGKLDVDYDMDDKIFNLCWVTLPKFRFLFPEYNDMSDESLSDQLYKKAKNIDPLLSPIPREAPTSPPSREAVDYKAECSDWGGSDGSYCKFSISLRGPINLTMLEKFHAAMSKNYDHYQTYIDLNSGGGSVETAMQIGRQIREIRAFTKIGKDEICVSACIFLLVAGVYRSYIHDPLIDVRWPPSNEPIAGAIFPEKIIGIHRPYIASFPGDISEDRVSDTAKQTYNSIKFYLDYMNIPNGVLDRMWYVPSSDVVWLKPWEIFQFHILGIDPIFAETIELQESRRLGITREEFMTRNKIIENICNIFDGPKSVRDCRDRVLTHGK